MRASMIVSVGLLGVLAFGCVPKDDANDPSQYGNGQPPPNSYPQPGQPGQPGQPTPYPNQPPPAPGQYPQQLPPGQGGPAPQAGGQATPIAPAMAAASSLLIQGLAAQEAPGMSPDGGAFAGQFQEGQVLEQPINLAPNKCYTIIGVGGPGIQDLQVQLVAQPMPGLPPAPLAQSTGNGPNATLGGGRGKCWKFMSPIGFPAKVVMKANKGAGLAAAQVFVK
jgi:hypothetical protein